MVEDVVVEELVLGVLLDVVEDVVLERVEDETVVMVVEEEEEVVVVVARHAGVTVFGVA